MIEILYGFAALAFVMWLILKMIGWKPERNTADSANSSEGEEDESQCVDDDDEDVEKSQSATAKEYFLHALNEIGCPYDIDDSPDELIRFRYQGETFIADVDNACMGVNVHDPCWLRCGQEDIDEMSRMRRVVNTLNINCHVRTVYVMNEKEQTFDIHSLSSFILAPETQDYVTRVRCELDNFFYAKHKAVRELDRLRRKEEAM